MIAAEAKPRCAAVGCKQQTQFGSPMCKRHFDKLQAPLRRAILSDLNLDPPYRGNLDEAIAIIARKEGHYASAEGRS